MNRLELLLLLLFLVAQSQCRRLDPSRRDSNDPRVCDVSEFGAAGDGKALDTAAIQTAIDHCGSRSSDSVVHISPGRYLTGTLFLKSNMTVVIEAGAVVLGSFRQVDYPQERRRWYVLLAEDSEHVRITGGGFVDGQGLSFVRTFNQRKNVMVSWNTTGACVGDECRPRLVGFVNCKHVRVWDVHLRQPAYWGLHIANSSDVSVHNCTMVGDFSTPNNDGIDVDGSNNTSITGCRLDTADDGVVAKSIAGPLFNLSVRDCWIRSKSCAVKVGSETYHDIAGLWFENLTIVDSHRGLGIQLRDKGSIFNVTFSSITLRTRFYDPLWWGRAEPIYVTACPRNTQTRVGCISSVKFTNITATSENGIFMAGSGGGFLSNMELVDVQLQFQRVTNFSSGLHDYRPGCQGLVSHRTAGIFMQSLSNMKLQNLSMKWQATEDRDWDVPLDFTPQTIGKVVVHNLFTNM